MSVDSIVPIILAAGDSLRMGYPKAILPLGTDTFITRILATLKTVELPKPIIVLGRTASAIRAEIKDWPADVIINPDPDRGQLSSIQLALSHMNPDSAAAMIWPVDQPVVSVDVVRRLTQLFISSEPKIAFPVHGDKNGHPAIFHRTLFQEFMEVSPEEGPRSILSRHKHATAVLTTDEPACIQDIDTPMDYQDLTGEDLDTALERLNAPKGSPR